MADTTLDDALARADAAIRRIERALERRKDSSDQLRADMKGVLADLDALIRAAETRVEARGESGE